uniref:G-protein coupled receptors family 2 profile 2 domain-containing protein n=1 Tax=Pectinophora gossypiella TaxID=13191 RepID=A0A1E1WIF6_PECGO
MILLHRNFVCILLLIICINITANAKKTKHKCPIGFSLAYTKYKGDDPICYRRKGPESFADKFKDCTGNLYTSKLYHSLNFTEPNVILWTDYKSLYPGGPFIDWSYTGSTGDILLTTYDVKYDSNLGVDEELCVVIDPVTNFTATRCDENYYRYCFVKPYKGEDDMDRDGCSDLPDYWRFYSPRATCLTAVTGVGGGAVRANWRQAKDLCAKRGGFLLNKGWRYANNPLLTTNTNPTIPLGIVLSNDNSSIRYDTPNEDALIPASEWQFEDEIGSNDTSLGALRDNFWYMVNGSYIFYDVICERTLTLKSVSLNVSVDPDNKLVLQTNDSVNERDIYCFSDSVIYFPTAIKVKYDDSTGFYVLKPVADGHYWCVHVDSTNHIVSESNKALFIREKQSLINYYAIKIRLKTEYKFENLEQFYRDWERKLEEYIFYRTKYFKIFGELELSDASSTEEALKSFKASHPGLKWKEVIYKIKIKRLYLDGKTALVHVQLNPEMLPVPPGRWDNVEVEFMKPIYYCKGFGSIPMMALGSTVTSSSCRNYTCVGDFDEGVQWVTTAIEECTTTAPVAVTADVRFNHEVHQLMPTAHPLTTESSTDHDMQYIRQNDSSDSDEDTERPEYTTRPGPPPKPTTEHMTTTEEIPTTTVEDSWTTVTETVSTVSPTTYPTETVSTVRPVLPTTTTTPRPPPPLPEEQLEQVLEDLGNLLQDASVPVIMEDVENAFDAVDILLETEEDLEIPGQLLHLLDELGGRIDLNGSHKATTIRPNIAMVLANAEPETPVRGLRIAARDDEAFTDDAFELITEVNQTQLASNQSEAVVHLPDSVVNSSRRISFVVFRNDRAFQSQAGVYTVNSRVLSIKVQNVTKFENGEVIDIHLSPMTEIPDKNVSRACAYWEFLNDTTESGYWSQNGCTFIRSIDDGVLDTCRCTHLTHFAEILVPRAVFSDRNEDVLEILTIVGCCLSIFGLFMIGLTAALFRSWRRDFSNKIWLQLCIAIFMLVICFLVVVFAKFDTYDIPCMLIGVLLHYSVLASFCWMLVAAVLSYRRLVIVFTRDASHKLLRASAFSWGAPCAVVGILLSVSPHSYAGRYEEKSPSGSFCYPSGLGLWLAVYAPIAVMLLANWTLFALIVRSVFASRRIQRHGDSNEAIRCASVSCLLVFLFGLPWLFGLFAYNIVAAYLFTLLATLQGFVLFLFFVLGNKKTRDLWLNKLKIKQTRKVPVTSSTYTHRSTGAGYRGGAGASTIEANNSKPKSLSSPDNSRFS